MAMLSQLLDRAVATSLLPNPSTRAGEIVVSIITSIRISASPTGALSTDAAPDHCPGAAGNVAVEFAPYRMNVTGAPARTSVANIIIRRGTSTR